MNGPANRVLVIFTEALEIADATAREAFLLRACGTDQRLRKEVEELLQAEAQSGQFLPDHPAGSAVDSLGVKEPGMASTPGAEQIGDRIGRYKLLEKIGEGGCGIVYMAEQEEPVRRKVALKVIKLGMDTRSVIARFEAERQALALMDHPNIAKVLDAGATESGRPFFVMELVKGSRITQYCDENELHPHHRLSLFLQVCQAVQHAHQKGIIHRDLKPSNVLVTLIGDQPVVKVIDFGIAKSLQQQLTDKTLFTQFQQLLGTPAYMSPEQAALSGLDIDTRSDIYSLGVLLYELLTGKTPFDSKRFLDAGLEGVRRIIREEDPPKPSTRLSTLERTEQTALAKRRRSEAPKLLGLIRGDLDWIVMKCLEKDRTRRYETANGLATDLQRHLNDEPVTARPPTSAYRFKKALSRHRFLFLGSSAVAVTLLLGICVSTWQTLRARRAEAAKSVLLHEKEQALLESEHQRRQALENEDRALSLLYASDMQAAHQAIEGGRLGLAHKLLSAHLPGPGQRDRRGFEWYYYTHEAAGQQAAVLLEQSRPFTGLDVARDGKMVALRDPEEIKAFDLPRRKVVARWSFPERTVIHFRIAPDGRRMAIGTTNQVELINLANGQATVLTTGRYDVLSFAPDRPCIALGRYLPSTREPVVQIWDYEQRRLVRSMPQPGGPVLWWETNSTVLAGLNMFGVLRRWDALTGNQIQEIADHTRPEKFYLGGAIASQAARGAVFQPGGLSVLDPTDGRVIWESDWPPRRFVAISANGRFVASCDDTRIRLAEVDKLQKYEHLAGHLEDVNGLAFVGATSNLVSCGGDGRLLLWEPKSPFAIPFVMDTNDSNAWAEAINPGVVLSSDQRYCSVYRQLWSIPGGKLVRRLPGPFLGFSPNGAEYATANSNQLQVWRCADPGTNPAASFRLPAMAEDNVLKLSADGRFVAAMNRRLNTLVFEARTGKVLANAAEQAQPNSRKEFIFPEFLPNNHRLVVRTDPGSIIWDWQAPTNRWKVLPGDFYSASADGHWIVLRDDTGLRLKIVDSTGTSATPVELEGHTESIISVAFSHDVQRLASMDLRNEIRFWKLPEGQLVGITSTRADGLGNLAFSPDDQRLYVTGHSGVQVLEAPRPEPTGSQSPISKSSAAEVPSGSVWSR